MTIAPKNPNQKPSIELDKVELKKEQPSPNSVIDGKNNKNYRLIRLSCLKNPAIWEWLKSGASVSLVALIATILWNVRTANDATQKYNANLVKDYIESVKTLILDDYHHGKTAKYPEISVEEIEAFVRAKTGNTLKAIKGDGNTEKQNLINFLTESGVGFFPPDKVEKTYTNNIIQNVCIEKETLGYQPKSQPKDYTFHHFFCGINLQGVDLSNVELNRVILENANLQEAILINAKLSQADLQGLRTNLNNVNLSNANLGNANLKDVTMTGAILDNATLNQANLRRAWLWQKPGCLPENTERQVPQNSAQKNQAKCEREQDIKNTSLIGAKLLAANLQDTDLKGVDLSNAQMNQFIIQDTKTKKILRTIPTNLRGADLRGANLRGADLRGANLRGATLKATKPGEKKSDCKEEKEADSQENLTPVEKTDAKIGLTWRSRWDYQKIGWITIPIPSWSPTTLENALYDKCTTLPFSDEEATNWNMIKIERNLDLSEKEDVDLSNSDLRGAELTNAILTGINLSQADLRGADLSHATIDQDKLLNKALYDDKTQLPFSDVEAKKRGMIKLEKEADLRGRDLSYVDLSGVELSNAKLQDANLTSIEFDKDTKFTDAEYDQHTRLPFDHNITLRYGMRYVPHRSVYDYLKTLSSPLQILAINSMIIDNKQLPVDWKQLPVNWSGEDHQQADLRKAILENGRFEGTHFKQAQFQSADLSNANFEGADLTEANLTNANLTNANLTNANLTNANLTNAKLTKADFTNANLTNANLTGVNLANFKNLDKAATLCRATLPHSHEHFERTKTDCPEPNLNLTQNN
ncbi:pentapeptide repeat-containing protein [Crocosphaera sp. XPORK-15E]|uniref:pentapeptide repeat-containing protein n=1 Tax=Crocosphaera sp. XPORK-15E TaxID=3110247 RepID=UPI002B21D1AF|nr:pentapeptide repeat-containing protein [Crocosphaera sp. XPORK-15E]MEA5535559.1 pentapeptide repeat-containing protein [Crocosphaera sp. XPORK-15E]